MATSSSDLVAVGTDGKPLPPLGKKARDACLLLTAGVAKKDICKQLKMAPERLRIILRLPQTQAFIARLNEAVGAQLEAQHGMAIDTIRDVMKSGNGREKIAAARLQLEASRRIGPRTEDHDRATNAEERLQRTRERLLQLYSEKINGPHQPQTLDLTRETRHAILHQPAQAHGDG